MLDKLVIRKHREAEAMRSKGSGSGSGETRRVSDSEFMAMLGNRPGVIEHGH